MILLNDKEKDDIMIDENKIIACKYEDKEKFSNIMNRKLNEILLKIIETIQVKEKIITTRL